MCNDLTDAMELHKGLDIPEDQKAMVLIHACKNSIDKLNKKFVEHVADANNRLIDITDEQKEQRMLLESQGATIKDLKSLIESSHQDAVRWQLVILLLKSLFGDAKKTALTTLYFGLIIGAYHMQDIMDIIKALLLR